MDGKARQIIGLKYANTCAPVFGPKSTRGSNSAKIRGIRYERHVGAMLQDHFELDVVKVEIGPWFHFADANGTGNCQPDVLIHFPDFVLIVEAKSTHCFEAYRQLVGLYSPVVREALGRDVLLLEITKSYDPAVKWPTRPHLIFERGEFDTWRATRRADKQLAPAVWIWKP